MTKYLEQRLIGALAWLSYAPSAESATNAQELLSLLERRDLKNPSER